MGNIININRPNKEKRQAALAFVNAILQALDKPCTPKVIDIEGWKNKQKPTDKDEIGSK